MIPYGVNSTLSEACKTVKTSRRGQRWTSNQWHGAHSSAIALHYAGLYSRRNRLRATNQGNHVHVSQLCSTWRLLISELALLTARRSSPLLFVQAEPHKLIGVNLAVSVTKNFYVRWYWSYFFQGFQGAASVWAFCVCVGVLFIFY